MKRRRRLFGLILLWHFGLTVATGLGWTALMTAISSHRTPALLDATYASVYLFVPFCQPVFWPLSDWVSRSGHFSMLLGLVWQCAELLVIAFINSLIASVLLFSLVWIVNIVRSHQRNQTAA